MFVSGNRRSYDDLRRQIPAQIVPLFDQIRNFCISLGDNVIEDTRMHRVVFCKSMTFRWFADVQPDGDKVIIKIQQNRKTLPKTIHISPDSDASEYAGVIKDAYEKIH